MAVSLTRRRFTIEEYSRMAQAGIFGEDDRVELIEGEIVEMTPIGSRHAAVVARLTALLSPRQPKAIVWVQNPIQLSEHSEPQPDVALLKPRADFYASAHPGPADVLLVVEVAETSAGYDCAIKIPLYARYGIREVWLVDLERGIVSVYSEPGVEGYRAEAVFGRSERLAPHAFPDLALAVEAMLGS